MKAGLDLPPQSASSGPPHSCLLWDVNPGEETQSWAASNMISAPVPFLWQLEWILFKNDC